MSFLDKKPVLFLWRPTYRFMERLRGFFFAEPLTRIDLLARQIEQLRSVQADFVSRSAVFEHQASVERQGLIERQGLLERQNEASRSDLAHRLQSLQLQNQTFIERFTSVEQHHRSILDRVSAMEQENRRQWEMLEQILLAFLSESRRGQAGEGVPLSQSKRLARSAQPSASP